VNFSKILVKLVEFKIFKNSQKKPLFLSKKSSKKIIDWINFEGLMNSPRNLLSLEEFGNI
jgi:hypothetical protein